MKILNSEDGLLYNIVDAIDSQGKNYTRRLLEFNNVEQKEVNGQKYFVMSDDEMDWWEGIIYNLNYIEYSIKEIREYLTEEQKDKFWYDILDNSCPIDLETHVKNVTRVIERWKDKIIISLYNQ